MIDTIIDVYHGNAIDLAAVKTGGIVAVIHKATEGTKFKDPKYRERRKQAKALGLLWGRTTFPPGAAWTTRSRIS